VTDPRTRSALAGDYHLGWHGAQSGLARLTYRERRGLTMLLMRGKPADAAFTGGVQAALGIPLPLAAGTTSSGNNTSLLWLGPDEWLVTGTPSAEAVAALRACARAVTDVSHGRTVVRVSGPTARDLLAKGLPLDLHPDVFQPGRCTQSTLARCNVVVHQVDDAPSFDLYVMRSYGRSLWHFLCTAGEELGFEVAAPIA
jgi:sarcosine oxidase subunit gamma